MPWIQSNLVDCRSNYLCEYIHIFFMAVVSTKPVGHFRAFNEEATVDKGDSSRYVHFTARATVRINTALSRDAPECGQCLQ